MRDLLKTDIELDEPKSGLSKVIISVVLLLLIIFAYNKLSFDNTVLANVGMTPFSAPVQTNFSYKAPNKILVENHGSKAYLTPIAGYKMYGRVYTKHYVPVKMSFGTIIPYDMAIGWGIMADKDMFKRVKMRYVLFDRVVYWEYKNTPFGYDEINSSFSNNHLIPANKNIMRGLKKLKVKDVVYIEGYLVDVTNYKQNGNIENMNSSLWRDDEGLGACEVIYVKRLVSRHGEYK